MEVRGEDAARGVVMLLSEYRRPACPRLVLARGSRGAVRSGPRVGPASTPSYLSPAPPEELLEEWRGRG